jgi:hypothetical protein
MNENYDNSLGIILNSTDFKISSIYYRRLAAMLFGRFFRMFFVMSSQSSIISLPDTVGGGCLEANLLV